MFKSDIYFVTFDKTYLKMKLPHPIPYQGSKRKFKERDDKRTLDIYKIVEHENLLNDLDKKTIEYCKRHA